ncbi:2-oxoglutarate dehydrogenase E1 component [Fangia hongkongensis]|uniref:2-oxoglutarate dehydrogenase E1 component n=1 Tax=Fangia hongkongensis TaxID=270495 RepID=UPI00036BC926|nr:2-oxoglutarate dehydrogenase E1 component [Fangia hongkongensis]
MSETNDSMSSWWETSQVSGVNSAYLDAIYEDYLNDPSSVDDSWKAYFDSLRGNAHESSHAKARADFIELAKNPQRVVMQASGQNMDNTFYPEGGDKVSAVMDLVYMYRTMGHKRAKIDPLGIKTSEKTEELEFDFHGLKQSYLNDSFNVGIFSNYKPVPLKEIVKKLEKIYTGSIGYEYMHLTNMAEKMWIRQEIENDPVPFSAEKKKWLLKRLSAAEGLEKYLGMKYVGQKRFSLEGGESVIPALNEIIDIAGDKEVKEIGLGMAHRGRLNVLVNIMGKSPENLFKEFEGSQDKKFLSGDVKYHLGFASWHKTAKENVRLALAFNPSHLETVDPVVEGAVRAKQDCFEDNAQNKIMPILIHGDSAFCGQGVVMETFALSQTRYYGTGGTIHIVINNQVGFTTDKKEDNRSSTYSTDIAKMVEAPVFHVNADDPEAVVRVAALAMNYRMTFNKDVVIDLVCYRRHGHNEADEPSGTQPEMYSVIKKLPTTRALYAKALEAEGVVSAEKANEFVKEYRDRIQQGKVVADVAHIDENKLNLPCIANWHPYAHQKWDQDVSTAVDEAHLISLAKAINTLPDGLTLQPQVKKAINDRMLMAEGKIPGNWGFAENLAYATLLDEGYHLRLSGEDSGRGTFSHRHAVLHNYDYQNKTIKDYIPLQYVNQKSQCEIIDSVLSEYAVLGYDYGYSSSAPESLVIWEAQFGDFANTAQVVIDQFIASAEEKWGLLSGLVMLLPHGQEGAGAEHSSARLERYLQLCANDNMQVCIPTTPAQMFHMLRRQMVRAYRKPLIVMSPKSLLRHPLVTSTLDELANGAFYNVIDEVDDLNQSKVSRVVLCSGKVYYDMLIKRREEKINDVALVRLEQLYPFPQKELADVLSNYAHVKDVVWAQEEPENQGAWWMIQHEIRRVLNKDQSLSYVGRRASSAPAVGYPSLFHAQQNKLVNDALKIEK